MTVRAGSSLPAAAPAAAFWPLGWSTGLWQTQDRLKLRSTQKPRGLWRRSDPPLLKYASFCFNLNALFCPVLYAYMMRPLRFIQLHVEQLHAYIISSMQARNMYRRVCMKTHIPSSVVLDAQGHACVDCSCAKGLHLWRAVCRRC